MTSGTAPSIVRRMNDQRTDPTDPTAPTDAPAVDVRCRNDPATRVRLTDRHFPDEHGTGFAVELHAEGLRARLDSVTAWACGPDHPADFLDELAADYRGWEAERTWRTHRLALRAVFRPGATSASPGPSGPGSVGTHPGRPRSPRGWRPGNSWPVSPRTSASSSTPAT